MKFEIFHNFRPVSIITSPSILISQLLLILIEFQPMTAKSVLRSRLDLRCTCGLKIQSREVKLIFSLIQISNYVNSIKKIRSIFQYSWKKSMKCFRKPDLIGISKNEFLIGLKLRFWGGSFASWLAYWGGLSLWSRLSSHRPNYELLINLIKNWNG